MYFLLQPSVMLPIWTSEFLQAVSRMDPKFIALHLQEVGGKAYEKSMQYVQDFVQRLCDCPELRLFDKIRIFLDEDFSSPEKFTALGNMYFAHSSLTDLKIWDFELKAYVDATGKEVHAGNIEKVTTKEKAKFPQHFFPECKWSRKGFLRTRWWVRGTAIEFVNIHLFHDASNLLAIEPFPSLQRFDRELEALRPHLYEFPVKFPPSYPFEEDVHLPTHYMKTRCPAWCDRVLLSQSARLLVQHDTARPADNRHMHASRKSVTDSTDSSGRVSSSDSSPARSASPAHTQGSPGKTLEKKSSLAELDGLAVPAPSLSRKSIADPTSVQQAISARMSEEGCGRRRLVRNQSEGEPAPRERRDPAPRRRPAYGVIGDSACMGDHKSDRGRLQCCAPPRACSLCTSAALLPSSLSLLCPLPTLAPLPRLPTDPDLYANKKLKIPTISSSHPASLTDEKLKRTRTGSLNETMLRIPQVEITSADSSLDGVYVNDVDNTLLSVRRCIDPYTPESIDSHSPNVEASSGSDEVSIEVTEKSTNNNNNKSTKLSRDRSVSPTQLKNRLDKLLSDKEEVKSIPELQRLHSRESCNFRQEFHSESSPKHIKPEDPENMTDPVADSPNSRYIHFNVDSPSNIFKETDI
ncbi:hypothetical protein HF086_008188 [Spodoptera exigua]|uniref:inositol-polyphosphate 5-phosphatase n=1 Tax=Spodoptera exigua TaxID=7107 RepID=A0A922S9W9_SPOEX|nr:hypothetical protein HF086_008188 [Spodoptera exigua]